MRKNHNLTYGIIFFLVNIIVKFAMYGYKTIWIDNLPSAVEGSVFSRKSLSNFNYIMPFASPKIIPFLIAGGVITILYELIAYKKRLFNNKIDAIMPVIIYAITELVLLYLFISQYKIY